MNEEIIDLPELLERVQDDKELLLELFDIFVQDFAVKRKSLEEYIKSKNYEEIRNIAHSLKGASGNISAKPLRAVCIQFEDLGKRNSVSDAQALLAQLDKEFERLVNHIAILRKQLQK